MLLAPRNSHAAAKKTAADGGEKKQVKGIYAAFKSRTNKWNYEEKQQITGDDADQL